MKRNILAVICIIAGIVISQMLHPDFNRPLGISSELWRMTLTPSDWVPTWVAFLTGAGLGIYLWQRPVWLTRKRLVIGLAIFAAVFMVIVVAGGVFLSGQLKP